MIVPALARSFAPPARALVAQYGPRYGQALRQAGHDAAILSPLFFLSLLPALVALSVGARPAAVSAQPLSETAPPLGLNAPPLLLRPLSAEEAVRTNAAIPFNSNVGVAARPFQFNGDRLARSRAVECLGSAVYYEAGAEDTFGQQAVAQVVLNRARHPAFPSSICGVVFEGSTRPTGCQFTFTCDGSLARSAGGPAWQEARRIAEAALGGKVFAPVGLSTHYHADYVVPYWATSLAKTARIGRHLFYTWPGAPGRPAAFAQRYARAEPDPRELRAAAIMVDQLWTETAAFIPEVSIDLRRDQQVDLAVTVAALAGEASASRNGTTAALKRWFGPEENHPLVNLYRTALNQKAVAASGPDSTQQLAIEPAALHEPALLRAVATNFIQQSRFQDFSRSQAAQYSRADREATRALVLTGAAWRAYTGIDLPKATATLSLAPVSSSARCLAQRMGARQVPILSWSEPGRQAASELFILASWGQDRLFDRYARIGPNLKQQIMRAILVRIVALSDGDAAGRLEAQRQSRLGHELVPVLAAKLRRYELQRAQYPTLKDFLPALIEKKSAAEASDHLRPASPCDLKPV